MTEGRTTTHVCKGVAQPYVTVGGVQETHFVCECGLLLAVKSPFADVSSPARTAT